MYFVTIICHQRDAKFKDERVAAATIECLKNLRVQLSFGVFIYCLMPNHFHALFGPRESAKTLGSICGAFKSLSTRHYWNWHRGKLWQRQFFDHIIRNQQDFEETVEYIRMNPVRRGLVADPAEWPYTGRLDYLGKRAGTSPAPTH
ncbi:MAG TPA: transposase [Pyrinomonadaceae bacterium]|nr:transposase [Pyrinomonadaceae bacterium]